MRIEFVKDCELEIHIDPSSEESVTELFGKGEKHSVEVVGGPLRFRNGSFQVDPSLLNLQFDDGSIASAVSRQWFREIT